MADQKISALTSATTPLAGTEVLPIVQSGATVKVATNDLTVRNIRANATTGILQVTGPAAASTRVVTVPDANWTAARTDAAQSFTGDQTINSGDLTIGTAGKVINFSAGNAVLSVGSASYSIFIGGGSFTPVEAYIQSTYAYIPAAYNNTTATAANVNVSSSGELKRSTSALKYKQDIRDVEDFDINGLRPVRYKSKCEGDDQTKDHLGLIADEAAEAGFEELVTRGETGEIEGFQYERLTVVLLKKIQVLETRLAALETK